ncbi:MAG: response regulator transcription factor [Polyangiaceae bacterium]|jgi:two-component system, OmpR family, alkaline phosphatase synthesis response regulator PhoP
MVSRFRNPGTDAPAQRTVLVVEDDASIALGLRINLEGEGYRVLLAENGERGLELARSEAPDLIVLDVMLPQMNGLEVLQALRSEGRMMPIIILSARTGEMDKVTGLELGAEDYVAKPFSLAELLARVRAALRRPPVITRGEAPLPAILRFGDVEMDVSARTVTRRGEPVEITATEFDVAMCLIESRGRAMPRDEIFQHVWGPNHHGTPRTIDNFIQQLRAKLEPDPAKPKHFLTVRGVGYRFVA